MNVLIRVMVEDDLHDVLQLWNATDGVGLNESDTPARLAAFLLRNPGMSFVALRESSVIGAVLCGHDGRRGYLHHLAVTATARGQGIGSALVGRCLRALAATGVEKCNIFVYEDNAAGRQFWERIGWSARMDLRMMQFRVHPS